MEAHAQPPLCKHMNQF